MHCRTLREKLIVALAGKVILFLAACAYLQVKELSASEEVLRSTQLEKKAKIESLVELVRKPGQGLIRDYSHWDELYDFVSAPDPEFGAGNLEEALSTFKQDGVWILNRSGTVVYSARTNEKLLTEVPPVNFSDLRTAMKGGKSTVAGFVQVRGYIAEINATQIYRTNDAAHEGEFSGYMVVADLWDNENVSQLVEYAGTNVSVQPIAAYDSAEYQPEANGIYVVNLPLKGFDGRDVGIVQFKGREAAIARLIDQSALTTFVFSGFSALLILSVTWLILIWVERPLGKIQTAIRDEKPQILEKLTRGRDEIGQLAQLVVEFFRQREELQRMNDTLERRVQLRTSELESSYDAVILGWSRAMDSKDKETEGHTQRVAQMAIHIGEELGLGEDDLRQLYRGALLHDIGKIGIPDSILLKPDSLTNEEMEIMKNHTTMAFDMLKDIGFLHKCLCIPLCHHERWDGIGYPQGLTGTEIPLLARVFSVADVWDALRSDRPYRQSWSHEKVQEYIAKQAGTQFDPQVVEAFLRAKRLAHPSDVKHDPDFLGEVNRAA